MATEPIATDRCPAKLTLRRTRRSHRSAAWAPGTTLGAVPLALLIASDPARSRAVPRTCPAHLRESPIRSPGAAR